MPHQDVVVLAGQFPQVRGELVLKSLQLLQEAQQGDR